MALNVFKGKKDKREYLSLDVKTTVFIVVNVAFCVFSFLFWGAVTKVIKQQLGKKLKIISAKQRQ